jgi:ATP-grasp ribosomal peptide maturase
VTLVGTREEKTTVLVLTAAQDETADAVISELETLGTPIARLDVGDFPVRMSLAARNEGGQWTGRLRTDAVEVELDRVCSVYYRRPTRFVMPPEMSEGDRIFAAAEARLGLGGILASLDAVWVNDPARVAVAEYKPRQLCVAAASGLEVPRTLITNDHGELLDFARGLDGPVVCKAFSSLVLSEGSVAEAVYTTPIDPKTIDPRQLAVTAHLIQEWVPKSFEVRVTMVGRTPHAAAIHATSEAGRIDWRADYRSLTYKRIDPPEQVTAAMVRYLHAFGLNYGAFDFVVRPNGQWCMLECNPAGQWLWLEYEAGLPIACELARLLSDGAAA